MAILINHSITAWHVIQLDKLSQLSHNTTSTRTGVGVDMRMTLHVGPPTHANSTLASRIIWWTFCCHSKYSNNSTTKKQNNTTSTWLGCDLIIFSLVMIYYHRHIIICCSWQVSPRNSKILSTCRDDLFPNNWDKCERIVIS